MGQHQMKMSPKRIIIVWIVATLVAAALLFPPFGYTRYSVIYAQSDDSSPLSVPWTYLQHGFVFAKPPINDPAVEASFNKAKFPGVAVEFNICIGWRFVAVECAVILLLGGAAFLTLGRNSN
jgi:hypothetical protein